MNVTKKYVDRFWSRVDKSYDNGCWKWAAGKNGDGYGVIRVNGRMESAHRVSWVIHNKKDIPKGMTVCHTCDNPPCINPSHLFLGTHFDNMRDMAEKGRANKPIGEKNGRNKLTEKEVIEIFYAKGVYRIIGAKYGITRSLVGQIKRKRIWQHITKNL